MPLNRQQVIDEALRLVDTDGLDALSLRKLATRLGVQAPTLYWHVQSKAELLDALADAIMDDALSTTTVADAGGHWREWLLSAAAQLRRAMLAHRDGARIVSASRDSLRRADFSERAMSRLVAHGVGLHRARLTVLTIERYTVGFVLEEQSTNASSAQPELDLDELRRRFPTTIQGVTEYFAAGRTVDDLYRDGVRLTLGIPLDEAGSGADA
ncbi:TetR/AcrR family transcriptional regulator C-terminal domain-containing protein [Microbacterium sp. BWT-B31]|uniref:TetR/AcrR family transcriptional regulator C-terminal domain-containing protein n=1 Tax=Microbacterium sp. BWT-B31 TaxID=3232072 RepID=UPI003526DE1C